MDADAGAARAAGRGRRRGGGGAGAGANFGNSGAPPACESPFIAPGAGPDGRAGDRGPTGAGGRPLAELWRLTSDTPR